MNKEKCHLEGNKWYSGELEGAIHCSTAYVRCIYCKNITCHHHRYGFKTCDKCATLLGTWSSGTPCCVKERYEKIYDPLVKRCNS